LRCSVGNSKSQLHKAKLKIRELLMLEKDGSVPQDIEEVEVAVKMKKSKATTKTGFAEETDFLAAVPQAAQSAWAGMD
jgi:flagellum-specific peptidoglycan hydrolase FlgJ